MTQPRSSVFTSVRFAEKRRWRGLTRVLTWAVPLVLIAAVLVVAALWIYASARIDGVAVSGLAGEDDGVTTTLVALRGPDDEAQSIAVVQTLEQDPRTRVLLLPTALRVDVLGRGTRPLGSFLPEGDAALLVEAVQQHTEIPLDHYLIIDLEALGRLVETLGGLSTCPTPGDEVCGHVAPTEVVARLTATGTAADDDPGRVGPVHDMLRNGLHEATRTTQLLRPLRARRLIDAYAAAVESDVDAGPLRLRALSEALAGVPPDALVARTVPGTRDDGAVRATEDELRLYQAFQHANPLPADVGTDAPSELTEPDVTVRVLNGVGRAGVAGEVGSFLGSKGFVLESTDNADVFDPEATTRVAAADPRAAELVASYLPGATVTELDPADLPDGVDVIVTVGADWSAS